MTPKRFFSAAAYMVTAGQAPQLASLMIQAQDDTQAEAELLWKLADTYPFSQVQATAIREVSVSMENSIAAKVCANLSELQIPETVRNALFVERAAEQHRISPYRVRELVLPAQAGVSPAGSWR